MCNVRRGMCWRIVSEVETVRLDVGSVRDGGDGHGLRNITASH